MTALQTGGMAVMATSGLQLVFAILLMALGIMVAYNCLKELFTKEAGSMPDEEPEWSAMGAAAYKAGEFNDEDSVDGAAVSA